MKLVEKIIPHNKEMIESGEVTPLINPNERKKYKDERMLYLSVSSSCLVLITAASSFSWTSPMLPILKSNNSEINPLGIPITPEQESLIAGFLPLGVTVGSFTLSKLADIFGRKKSLIFFSVVDLISFLILAFTSNIYNYYLARFVQGNVFGFVLTVLPLYISEITDDHNRGKFGSFMALFITVGNLYGYVIAPFFNLKYYTLLCATPLVVNILIFAFFVPESPVYLVFKGNLKKARQSLRRVSSRNVEVDLLEIQMVLNASSELNAKHIFEMPGMKKALTVSVGVNVMQQASGILVVLSFLGPILAISNMELSGNNSAILASTITSFAGIVSINLVDKLGRRTLLLISSLVTSISLFSLGLDIFLSSKFDFVKNISWLPFFFVTLYLVGYGIGLGPVPAVITSEIFLNDFKYLAVSITIGVSASIAALLTFCFPLISEYFGQMWCFWMFSFFCVSGTIFVYRFVPETKGKHFMEIHDIFVGY